MDEWVGWAIYFIWQEAGTWTPESAGLGGCPLSASNAGHSAVFYSDSGLRASIPPYPDYPTAFTFIHATLHIFTLTF